MSNTKYDTLTVADIAGRINRSEGMVRKYIHDGDLGSAKKGKRGFWRIEQGAIGKLIISLEERKNENARRQELQHAKRIKQNSADKKRLMFVPRYTTHQAEDLARESMKENVAKHINAWKRDLDESEIEFRKSKIQRSYYNKLLSETDGVPRDDLSEAERRVALQAPVFMMDTLSRMQYDDMTYFLSVLKQYYDLGYDIDGDARLSFIINNIILEQIQLGHRQTLSLTQEYSIDKDVDDAMSRSMTRIDKLFKMLREHETPDPLPKDGDPDGLGKSSSFEMS